MAASVLLVVSVPAMSVPATPVAITLVLMPAVAPLLPQRQWYGCMLNPHSGPYP